MNAQVSRYNLTYDRGERVLVYNTRTGCLAVVAGPDRHRIKALTESAGTSAKLPGREPLLRQLHELGILIDEGQQELAEVKARYWRAKFDDPTLRMMLSTTFRCNFSCDYCFEGVGQQPRVPRARMSEDVENAIADEVRRRIGKLLRIEAFWFGGEPLLNRHPIDRLGHKLRGIAAKAGVAWHGEIISNGLLLTRDTAQWLTKCGVEHAQVTLDGDPQTHDGRRYTGTGNPTFDRIIANVVSWQEFMEPKLRVNVDRRNVETLALLVDALVDRGVGPSARLHFGLARNFNAGSLGTDELSGPEFRRLVHPIYSYALQRGLNIDYGISLRPKCTVCDAARVNTMHVGPDGTVWRCFPCIGTERGRCGNVLDPSSLATRTGDALLYDAFDPFAAPECANCALLPMCLRRCPYEEFSLCANSSVCDAYRLDELGERLDLVVASGNRNHNVVQLVELH